MRHLALTTTLAALALPATAAASQGVVLSVKSSHQTIEVVDSHHIVHGYTYAGKLPKLHPGVAIGYAQSRGRISHVRVISSKSRSVAFYGKVVRTSAHGVVLGLADGSKISFSSSQVGRHHHKITGRHKHLVRANIGGISVNIQGLEPGVTVLITETVAADGSITITITFPGSSAPGVGGQQQASGVIAEVDTDAFILTTGDGSDLRLHMAADKLASLNLQTCDTATVSYHQDGGMLIVDTVNPTGSSNSGDCAGSSSGDDQDVIGAITQVSADSVTINTPDHGPMTFQVDSSAGITDGFIVGDTVDVTYYANGDGTYTADDVEYDDQDVTGTVTSVSDSAVTITDDSTGNPATFTVNPDDGYLDGVSVGDQVDISFYLNNGQAVVDWVDDLSTD